ncbi:unnamed protein product [Acanthoscelides obtectus]|uniref:Ubiquitin carboxyl-terminal hydrolase n=1 Tax=Acanthoscelides obtectus TaxID=200917 RepID=A0A9P0LQJ4_ACAOB|nr:unnamed protein product [Acanthoscelides obtectus]CAK1657273.1 Ubiquitin carboxyl-terminal hydrolase [Acanthoscelides obtectus]
MDLFPLESNPEFIHVLGVPDNFKLVDVYGLDDEPLSWLPRPVIAFILLFPCSEKFYEHCKKEDEEIAKKPPKENNVWFMKQHVSNACGTIALLHCIANNGDRLHLKDGVFKKWLEQVKDKTPDERGVLLAEGGNDTEAFKLISAHQQLAMEGQTEVNPDEKVNHHFIAILEKDGELYELDGRRQHPVYRGATDKDKFVHDAAAICKTYMERDSDDINFTVLALTGSDS